MRRRRFFSFHTDRDSAVRHWDLDGLSVEVVRRPVRRLNLTVHPPLGRVRVSAPIRMDEDVIREFILSRRMWIERHQSRIQKIAQSLPPNPNFVTGDRLWFRGRSHTLRVTEKVPGGRGRTGFGTVCGVIVTTSPPEILLTARAGASREERRAALHRWQRHELRSVAEPMIRHWESVIGVQTAEWGIKRMKTKWGTCNPRARRIWLNLDLIQKPDECLEYLVVHELLHLIEARHNAHFYSLMTRFLPNWKELRHRLKNLNSHEEAVNSNQVLNQQEVAYE